MTTTTLSPSLRVLIDERLDGIDRVLQRARTPRPERMEILDSVENQIMEMLARRCPEEPTRRDVLAVLSEIDPPEAYSNGNKVEEREAEATAQPSAQAAVPAVEQTPAKWSVLALLAGIGVPVWIMGFLSTIALVYLGGGDSAAFFLMAGMAVGVVAAFTNTTLGVIAMVKIVQSKGRLKGMLFAASGATIPLLLLFHAGCFYLGAVLIDSAGAFLVPLALLYMVALPLPVAWALFEMLRFRMCEGVERTN